MMLAVLTGIIIAATNGDKLLDNAIIDASVFNKLPYFLNFAKNAMKTIKWSYCLAITYNIIGLSFALSNNLSPLVAAIIMPVSTASIISFVTVVSNYFARKS